MQKKKKKEKIYKKNKIKGVIFNSVSSVQQGKPPSSGKAPKEEQEHGHWLNFDVDNFENSMVSSASDCN